MTPLERALRKRISEEGSMTLEAYMEACNAYYYATRDPLGADGDFTTAPEISQMFGEVVGAVLADTWHRAGKPLDAAYVELGPGRGTLARDALRVLHRAGFEGAVHFLETSPILRACQQERVPGATWHEALDDIPEVPLLLIANEFLDALPIRQHVDGVERRVIVAAGGLAFDRDGEVVETSPARAEVIRWTARHCASHGGVSIFIDYGHGESLPGDTLQAVRNHRYAPVLVHPGEQDLTSHVNFGAFAEAALADGVQVTRLATQGDWLMRLGIVARAGALSKAHPQRAEELRTALHRLTSPAEMGTLFKVIGIHSSTWPAPAGFA